MIKSDGVHPSTEWLEVLLVAKHITTAYSSLSDPGTDFHNWTFISEKKKKPSTVPS